MRRAMVFALSLAWLCPAALPQTTEPEKRTMEAVLAEIRQLRQDLQIAAIAARKAQIVIYRLHVQREIVVQVTEDLDNRKRTLEQLERQIGYQEAELKRWEESKDDAKTDQERNQAEQSISGVKEVIAAMLQEKQEIQSNLMEKENELRAEQAKWVRLDEELERLESSLEVSAMQAANNH